MGQYTIKDIESRAEVLKNDVDNIYRALHTKLGKSPGTLDQVPQSILDIPDPLTDEPFTITPSVDRQEFYANSDIRYNPITVEPVTSAIDSNIQPENIKLGVSILGVMGTLSGSGPGIFAVPNGMKFGYSNFTEIPSNFDFNPLIVCPSSKPVRESENLMDDVKSVVRHEISKCEERGVRDWATIKSTVKENLRDYIFIKTKRNPMILPIISEV